MIDFTLMNKALKSIWIKRFHQSENSTWTVIPTDEATLHLGDLTFLATCNCYSNDLNIKGVPLFYWFELKDGQSNTMPRTKKTIIVIIWNTKDTKDIKIDNKTIFFRT